MSWNALGHTGPVMGLLYLLLGHDRDNQRNAITPKRRQIPVEITDTHIPEQLHFEGHLQDQQPL